MMVVIHYTQVLIFFFVCCLIYLQCTYLLSIYTPNVTAAPTLHLQKQTQKYGLQNVTGGEINI